MALVHERLYQSQDLSRVDFGEYVRNLASYLFQAYSVDRGSVDLVIEVEEMYLGIDTAIPCGLIVNELVSNSLKHAFPDGRSGKVFVYFLSAAEESFRLIVSDNGVGFPKDLDFRNTPSLGMQLVNTLVSQIEGTVEIDNAEGTAFTIEARW